jgi:RNA polymerase sigma factor (sigma-70 family)
MDEALMIDGMTEEQDRSISNTVAREGSRLRRFIASRVSDASDAEDLLQEVFYELVEAVRLLHPIDQAGAWLFRVARNRIIDRFRKQTPERQRDVSIDDDAFSLDELLPSAAAGPEAEYARSVLLGELDAALDELPDEQRDVFVAHELEGRSFKELAAATGSSINTLLSRKHYAVVHLRRRLRGIDDEVNESNKGSNDK